MEHILEKDRLTPEEKQQLLEWDDDVFDVKNMVPQLSWRPKDHHLLLYDHRRPLSLVSYLIHPLQAPDSGYTLRLFGIGSVVTPRQFQGRGYATRLLRHAVEQVAPRLHVDFGLLFCLPRMEPFYQNLGWKAHSHKVWIDQPSGLMISPDRVMTYSFSGKVFPLGDFQLGSLPW